MSAWPGRSLANPGFGCQPSFIDYANLNNRQNLILFGRMPDRNPLAILSFRARGGLVEKKNAPPRHIARAEQSEGGVLRSCLGCLFQLTAIVVAFSPGGFEVKHEIFHIETQLAQGVLDE